MALFIRNDEDEEDWGSHSTGKTFMGVGTIIDDSGLILTVVRIFLRPNDEGHITHITTDQIFIQFNNGFFTRGKLLGYDAAVDIAVVRFDPSNLDFRAADLADVSDLAAGEQVIAIYHPRYFRDTFAAGYTGGNRGPRRLTAGTVEV